MRWKKLTTVSALGLAVGALVAALGFLGPNRAIADPPFPSPPRLLLVAAPVPQPGPRWEAKHTITRDHPVVEVSVQKEFVAFADEGGNILLWKLGDNKPEVLVKGIKQEGEIRPVAHLTYTPEPKVSLLRRQRRQRDLAARLREGGTEDLRHTDRKRRLHRVRGERRIVGRDVPNEASVVWLRPNGWDNLEWSAEDMRFDADVTHLVFAPEGNRLAAVTDDGKIHIIDREGLKVAHKIEVKNLRAKAVRFSPDGKTLAVVGENRFARLYDATTGTETVELKGLKGIVFDCRIQS